MNLTCEVYTIQRSLCYANSGKLAQTTLVICDTSDGDDLHYKKLLKVSNNVYRRADSGQNLLPLQWDSARFNDTGQSMKKIPKDFVLNKCFDKAGPFSSKRRVSYKSVSFAW